MSRTLRSFALALSVAVIGCGGDSLAPSANLAHPKLQIRVRDLTATSATITVASSGGTFTLGRHSIRFPKRSICALTSSYGPTEWDKPCEPAKEPVTFQVQIVSENGRQWLDFTPAVRFVPTTNPRQYVTLFMNVDGKLSNDISENDLQILWSPAIGVPGVDESIADPTQRTFINRGSGMMHRRIKHFSGYNIHDGVACDPDVDVCDPVVDPAVDGQ